MFKKVFLYCLIFTLVGINVCFADIIDNSIAGITDFSLPGTNMPSYKEPGHNPTPPNIARGTIKLPVVKIGLLNIATKDIAFKPIRETGIEKNYWAGAREACMANGMRLPTPDELDAIFTLRSLLGQFKPAYYWTSKSFNDEQALAKAFYEQSVVDYDEYKISGALPKSQLDKPRIYSDKNINGLSSYQDKNDSTIMARCVR